MNRQCYHCGLPVPANTDFTVIIKGEPQAMCCPGCQAVATAIITGGLDRFYQYRSQPSAKPDHQQRAEFEVYDLPEVAADYVDAITEPTGHTTHRVRLAVEGITCAACAWLIERHLAALPGVQQAGVNVSARRATIVWAPEQCQLSDILNAFAAIGYTATPLSDESPALLRGAENRSYLVKLGIAGLGMMQAGMLAIALYAGAFEGIDPGIENFLRWVSLLFATPIIFYSGSTFLRGAWRNLSLLDFRQPRLSMDVPVAVALLLAYFASVWATVSRQGEIYFDAVAMFVFFLLLGRYLEMRVRHRNEIVGERVAQNLPVAAAKVEAEGVRLVPVKRLQPNDIIRVAAGDTLPCDGLVVEGRSQVSEALLTGEERPIAKDVGSEVSAGSINGANPLTIKVTAIGPQTRLSAILYLVERAQTEKPVQTTLADHIAGYFVLGLLIIAVATALWWWQHDPQQALWVVVSVLVVACPCALSLATPTALAVALSELRSQGFLITRGHVIEALADIEHVVFDKTGTLTEGRQGIVEVLPLDTVDKQRILALAAALEADVRHPIAQAFRDIRPDFSAIGIVQHTGFGITGIIAGERYGIGRAEFISEYFEFTPPAAPDTEQTCLLLATQGRPLAWLLLDDRLRPSAKAAVAELGAQAWVHLLSGDRPQVVAKLARELTIDNWRAGLTPVQKLAALQELQRPGQKVLMAGDGINDIPVLSAADVSVAVGEATDLARVHADSILLSGDLSVLPAALALARRTRRIIRQNLTWAALYNLGAIGFAVANLVPPWAAAIGMSASSLLVVLNAMRLYRRLPRTGTVAAAGQLLVER